MNGEARAGQTFLLAGFVCGTFAGLLPSFARTLT